MSWTTVAHAFPMLLAQAQIFAAPRGAEYMRILPELMLSVFGMIIMDRNVPNF